MEQSYGQKSGTSSRNKVRNQRSQQRDPKLAMLWKMFGLIAAAPRDVRESIFSEYEETFSSIAQECVTRTLHQTISDGNQTQVQVSADLVPVINYLKTNPQAVDQLLAAARNQ